MLTFQNVSHDRMMMRLAKDGTRYVTEACEIEFPDDINIAPETIKLSSGLVKMAEGLLEGWRRPDGYYWLDMRSFLIGSHNGIIDTWSPLSREEDGGCYSFQTVSASDLAYSIADLTRSEARPEGFLRVSSYCHKNFNMLYWVRKEFAKLYHLNIQPFLTECYTHTFDGVVRVNSEVIT